MWSFVRDCSFAAAAGHCSGAVSAASAAFRFISESHSRLLNSAHHQVLPHFSHLGCSVLPLLWLFLLLPAAKTTASAAWFAAAADRVASSAAATREARSRAVDLHRALARRARGELQAGETRSTTTAREQEEGRSLDSAAAAAAPCGAARAPEASRVGRRRERERDLSGPALPTMNRCKWGRSPEFLADLRGAGSAVLLPRCNTRA